MAMVNQRDVMSTLVLLVSVGILYLSVMQLIASAKCMMGEGMDPNVTDYDCDIRIGCNTRDLSEREVTNIVLERERVGQNPSLGSIDLTKWQPGVDRPFIAQLEIDKKLRSEDIMERLSGRDESDFVFQQFGNDGTVINPRSNPLFRPSPPILA